MLYKFASSTNGDEELYSLTRNLLEVPPFIECLHLIAKYVEVI